MSGKSALNEGSQLENKLDPTAAPDAESSTSVSDERLAEFLEVSQQRRTQLLWLARRYANTREEAEDIVQEALMKAFRHLAKFRGDSHMGTWLGVIVLNVGREWVRSRKEPAYLPLEYLRNEGEDTIVIDPPDPCLNPEQSLERREMENILYSEIEGLNSVCKSAIQLCALDGLSHLEAANALDVNVYTIKSRIFHAKRMLKRKVSLRAGVQNALKRSSVPQLLCTSS